MNPFHHLVTAAVLTAVLIQPGQALAHSSVSTAVGSCQASLPEYDEQLRKRPLGIRNEGTTGAFISCASQWGYRTALSTLAYVTATNLNGTAVDLTCTLVDGFPMPGYYTQRYHLKTISLAKHSSSRLEWVPADYYYPGTSLTNYENFSCYLPPGVEVNTVGFDYTSTADQPSP